MIADVYKFHDRRLFKVATQFVQLVNNVSKQFVNNFSVTYRRQLVMEFHRDSCLFHDRPAFLCHAEVTAATPEPEGRKWCQNTF